MAANLWFFYALGAAMFWGLGYVLTEKLLVQGFAPSFLMAASALITLPCYLLLAWKLGDLRPGFELATADGKTLALLVLTALLVIGGNFLIFSSIAGKNATMAAIIEISYPFFTLFFAWLLFRGTG